MNLECHLCCVILANYIIVVVDSIACNVTKRKTVKDVIPLIACVAIFLYLHKFYIKIVVDISEVRLKSDFDIWCFVTNGDFTISVVNNYHLLNYYRSAGFNLISIQYILILS